MVNIKNANALRLHGSSYEDFINSADFAERTKIGYRYAIRKYMESLGYINDDDKDADNGNVDRLLNNGDSVKIQTQVKNFLSYMRNKKNLSPRSLHSLFTGLKSYFEYNDIDNINWKKIHKHNVGKMAKKVNDMPYTYDDLKRLLDFADERTKVVLMLMATSGMRRGAVNILKLRDLEWIDEHKLFKITVYNGDLNSQYTTFITPEASKMVQTYLKFRERHGEILKPENPLVRDQFNSTWKKPGDTENIQKPQHLSVDSINSILSRLLFNSGIRNAENVKVRRSGERHVHMATHSCRKFFKSKMMATEPAINPVIIEFLMGHIKSTGLEAVYYKPTEHDLLQNYIKAIPYLTINEENRQQLKIDVLTARDKRREQVFLKILEEMRVSKELREEFMKDTA